MDHETKQYLDAKFAEERAALTEAMRDMQSELLRGFAAFSNGQTIRLRKVEADQSNLDAALSGGCPSSNRECSKSSCAWVANPRA